MTSTNTLETVGDILIVDDVPANLRMLASILSEAGYSVRAASGGPLALEAIEVKLPDLILLDVKMPEMDGYEVCRRLKASERSRDIPVIFVSSAEELAHKVQGFEVGGVDYVTKPFQAQEVLVRVKTHFDLSRLRSNLEEQVKARTAQLEAAHEELRRSEERYRDFIAGNIMGIYRYELKKPMPVDLPVGEQMEWIKDGAVIAETNDAAARMHGLSCAEEGIGLTYRQVGEPDEQASEATLRAWIEAGYKLDAKEVRLKIRDGRYKWFYRLNHGVVENGYLTGSWGTILDITDRKRAEEALRLTQYSVDNCSTAIYWHRSDGAVKYANETACRQLGYSREELLSVSVSDIDPNWSAEDWPMGWQKLKEAGVLTFESRHRRKDGHIFPVEVTTNYFNCGGEEYVFAFVTDITERKRAEESLAASEHLYRTLFESAGDAIAIFQMTPRGFQYVDANVREIELLGCQREELHGLSPVDFSPPNQPDGRSSSEKALEVVTAALAGETQRFEWKHCRKDGTLFDSAVTLTPVEVAGEMLVLGIRRDITESKQVLKALKDSETKLHAIFDHHYQFTGLLDGEGRLLAANKTALDFAGADESEVIGQHFWDTPWWGPSQQPTVRHAIERAAKGEFVRFETTHVRVDGEVRDFDFSLSPVQNDDGNVVYLVPEGRDITAMKRAEEELREHEAMIRALVETSRDWIWAINLQGIHTYCNPAIKAILGYRPDEVVGKRSLDLIHEEDRKMVEAQLPKWVAEKRGWNDLVLRWRHKDGSWRYLESNAVPIVDAAGELMGFRGVDRDITERRNAQQALEESEERYRSLFEDALDMIHIVDANGIIIDANRTELETLGYTREEYIGKPLREVIHPDRREDTVPSAQTVLSGKPVRGHETALITQSGERIDVEVSAAPQVRGNKVVAARAIIRDIRERKRHEEALRLKSSYLQLLKSAAVAANEATSVEDAFRTVIDEVCAITGWQLGTVMVPTNDSPRRIKGLGIWSAHDDPRLETLRRVVDETGWAMDEGVPGEVFKSGRPLILGSGEFHPDMPGRPHARVAFESGLNLVAFFPVLVGNEVVAAFAFGTSETDQPDPALLNVMADIGLQLGRVVERKRTEDALRDSETKLHAIFDHHYQLTGLLDGEGRVLAANKTALDFAGADESEMIGQYLWETPWWGPSQQTAIRHAIERAAKGEFVRFEATHPRVDGEVRDFDFSLSPVRDDDGNVKYLVPEGRDITEMKRAEQKMRRSELRYRALFENMPVVGFTYDREGRVLSWNHAAEQIYGYSKDEAIGASAYDLIVTPMTRKATEEVIERVFEGECVLEAEWQDRNKAGQVGWRMGNTFPLVASDGSVDCGVNLNIDITERRNAQQALQESEERLALAQDAAGMGMFDWDIIHDRAVCNERYFRLFGLEPQKRKLSQEDWLGMVHPADRDRARDEVRRALEKKAPYDTEYRVVWPDNSVKWVSSKARVFYDDNDGPGRMIGVLTDITEAREAEVRQRETEARLAHVARLSTMGEMMAGIGHEVNQPLYAIRNYTRATQNRLEAEGSISHL